MGDYKNDLDKIHAPEALIEKTLKSIDEYRKNEQTQNESPHTEYGTYPAGQKQRTSVTDIRSARKHHGRLAAMRIGVAAAAAAVVIAVLVYPRDRYTWTEIPGITVSRETAPENSGGAESESSENEAGAEDTEVDAGEYSDFIGTDVRSLIEGADYSDGSFVIEKDGENVTGDMGICYYDADGADVMLIISKTNDVTPETMKDLKTSRVEKNDVILAKSDEGTEEAYYAAGSRGELSYYMYCRGISQAEFRMIVKNFLKD